MPVEKTVNSTDPEAGILNRPGKPVGPHYLSHQSVDSAHGIIVDVAVAAGNAADSVPYLDRIEYMRDHVGLDIHTVGADSAYGTSLICQTLEDMGISLYTPGPPGGSTCQVKLTREDFCYQADVDSLLCPAGKKLTLHSLEREEYNVCRVYRAERKDCQTCPLYEKCVSASQRSRTLRVNIFEEAVKRCRARKGTPKQDALLKQRQIWCEGTFAAQKARHNLRRLNRRGLEAAESHCLLSAVALNLKRMVKCLG